MARHRHRPTVPEARIDEPHHRLVLALTLLVALVAMAACGGDGTDEVTAGAGAGAGTEDPGVEAGPESAEPTGRIHVQLEEVDGVFIEGFEVGLRFETGAGDLIAATLWSDFVSSAGQDGLDAYYESVLTQPVPAGSVRVSAEVNIGMGPGPSVPDLTGPLPCSVEIDVPPGQDVTVEVSFDGSAGCLRVTDGRAPTDATSDDSSTSTTLTMSSAPATSAPAPSLAVGTSHDVDVDLECQAFELGGRTWVLDGGDTSAWQPPGERHEGGTFTIERDGFGRFVGDAAGEKTATFRRLEDGTEPPCAPMPRPQP